MFVLQEILKVRNTRQSEAVKRLIDKCRRLLTAFLTQFHHRFGDVNYCHCPYAWAPPGAPPSVV